MNLNNYLDSKKLKDQQSSIKKIFFYRICGTGMGAAACLLQEAGYTVEGADFNFYPPMSDYLKSAGVKCQSVEDIDDDYYKNFDLIVVGNSLAGASKSASFIEELGVSFTSFPECLGAFILDTRKVIGVAGTHGKTTTTYFMTQLLESLGEKPGYLIGGVLGNGRPSSALGTSKYFTIESDEYDSAYFKKISKFRLYEIDNAIITSLEFDHGDIFNSIDDIEDEFRALLNQKLDSIVANTDYSSIKKLQQEYPKTTWINYNATNDIKVIQSESNSTSFELEIKGKKENLTTNLVGLHNILNLSACIKFLVSEGFDLEIIKKSCQKLLLVKRRQEVRGNYKGSIVIDDFAHHPRAVELTLDGIKKQYPDKKVVTIFEPISSTARSNIFQNEFAASFLKTDSLIIANAGIKSTVKKGGDLDYEKLKNDIGKNNIPVHLVSDLSQLRKSIDNEVSNNSVLLVLSNRTCLGLWESDFVNELT